MKDIYKIIALCCVALSAIIILLAVIAWFAGGKLLGHWWISYLNLTHYLMMFGILVLLMIIVDKDKKE